jgi:SAM-dependent methyltransferase
LTAPFLLFAEVQVGSLVRRGAFYSFSMDIFRSFDPWAFAGDLVLGSLIVGAVLGALGGVAAYGLIQRTGLAPAEESLIQAAAQKYLVSGMAAWEFANGKLRYDPVYREILRKGLLPQTGTFVDLGCGRGFLLALLAVAQRQHEEQAWPGDWPAPPRLVLRGLERQPRRAEIARSALDGAAVIEVDDLIQASLPRCRAAALIDVLHYLGREEQDVLLERLSNVLETDGVLLIREADADGGWRFRAVQFSERLRSLARGRFRQTLCYRSARAWVDRLEELGFTTMHWEMGKGTPFANVLVEARRRQ